MRLPHTARSDEQNIFPLVDVLPLGELEHKRFVDRWLLPEIKLVERLRLQETGRLEPSFGGSPLPFDQLQFAEPLQICEVIEVFYRCLRCDFLAFFTHRR